MNTLMYLACMLIWGLNFIAVKIQGTDNPLEVSLLYRSAIAFVLFFGLYWWKIRPKRQALAPKLLGTVMGFGLCSFALSYLLLYYATLYSSDTSNGLSVPWIFTAIKFKPQINMHARYIKVFKNGSFSQAVLG